MNRLENQIIRTIMSKLLIAILVLWASNLLAQATSPEKQIKEAIQQHMSFRLEGRYAKYDIQVQPIDHRLKIAACDQLKLQHRPKNRNTGRMTMKVSCRNPSSWQIHVPFLVTAFDHVVVANQPIAMGTKLREDDLKSELKDISLLHQGYYSSVEQISGFITKRPIHNDQIITPSIVNPARMVNRGEKVVIQAQGIGLNIRTTGIAMEDGVFGELIQVRNAKTNKLLEGRISAPGMVKVSM